MPEKKIHDAAADVTAKDGSVVLDGPDYADAVVTPEAEAKFTRNEPGPTP